MVNILRKNVFMIRRAFLVVVVFGLAHLGAAEAGGPTPYSLAKTLSAEEFARAGLNKLTPDELAFLEAALARQHGQGAATVAAPTPTSPAKAKAATKRPATGDAASSDFGAEQVSKTIPANDGGELHTRIEGTVQEFSGRAVFVLANGQVWQQRIPQDVFLSKKLVNPEVTLLRTSLGYKMIIDAANVVVYVKRVQ
jgi:hypothetical protein